MKKWQLFRDDMLYYSNAWEWLVGILLCLTVMLIDLWTYGRDVLWLYGGLIALFAILFLFRLLKGRKFRLSQPEADREKKIQAFRENLFYDNAKKYFITGGLLLILFVLAIISNVYSPWYVTTRFPALPLFYSLYFLVLGILSVRYERRQHQEFLKEHPECSDKQ